MSPTPTPYRIECPNCGSVYLSQAEYERQMREPALRWRCPLCAAEAEWDDANYEARGA